MKYLKLSHSGTVARATIGRYFVSSGGLFRSNLDMNGLGAWYDSVFGF